MNIHKWTKLTPVKRREIADKYFKEGVRISVLSREYHTSRNTIYNVINRARINDFSIHKSVNKRYRCLKYGLKRLAKIEKQIEEKLKQKAKRYNKSYPGEMIHSDNTQLPKIIGDTAQGKPETLYVAIDDFSRELYAAIMPDRTQYSSAAFLKQVLEECPYTIEQWYTDNGTEYKGNPKEHEFMKLCEENEIKQSYTKVKTPRTNGKAERVIRTIQEMWHNKTQFKSRVHRQQELIRFVNYYNTVKPHKGIGNLTPLEKLIQYFYPQEL
jgi:transposase InsO family protein